MNYYDLLGDYISRQDLSSDLAMILDMCGKEILTKLLRRFKGGNVYFSQKPFVNAKIRLAKDLVSKGANKKEVASKLGIFWADIDKP